MGIKPDELDLMEVRQGNERFELFPVVSPLHIIQESVIEETLVQAFDHHITTLYRVPLVSGLLRRSLILFWFEVFKRYIIALGSLPFTRFYTPPNSPAGRVGNKKAGSRVSEQISNSHPDSRALWYRGERFHACGHNPTGHQSWG